ncbi:MAG: amidase [Silicimonas sp.]|nr:amidase [Silicimonas sp.]
MQDWLWASATDLGRRIGTGAIDPVALTEAYLDAIANSPLAPRIYVHVTAERARREAAAAADRARAGSRLSALDGVPISWKDLYHTAGVESTSGSAMLAGRIPKRDAKVVQNAGKAGLVCLGKTHQTELAFSGLGLNPVTQSPPCVNDAEAVSGGSSSGAAASVAFGLAAAAIGSDTGGSVRIPSVWNDLVGLKTVSGRLSLEGVVPLCARFDTVGPLCRSLEDAALLLAALEGSKPADLADFSLEGARLGILKTTAFGSIEDAPRAAFENAAQRLQNAGAIVEPFETETVSEAAALGPILFPAEAYGTWRDLIEEKGDMMYGPVRARFLQGKTIMAADFIAGWHRLEALRQDYHDAVCDFDAVILPSSPIRPPKMQALLDDDAYFTAQNLLALQNTRIGNLLGLTALTLPTGVPSCGIMVQGRREEDILAIGKAMEAALS